MIPQILEVLKIEALALTERLDYILRTSPKTNIFGGSAGPILITPRVKRIIDLANEEANRLKDEYISTEHIFLAILNERSTPAARLLEGTGITRERVDEAILPNGNVACLKVEWTQADLWGNELGILQGRVVNLKGTPLTGLVLDVKGSIEALPFRFPVIDGGKEQPFQLSLKPLETGEVCAVLRISSAKGVVLYAKRITLQVQARPAAKEAPALIHNIENKTNLTISGDAVFVRSQVGAAGPSALRYCSQCGNRISPTARFCDACGANLQPL